MPREYTMFGVWDIETSVEMDGDGKPVDTWLSYGIIRLYSSRDASVIFSLRFTDWETLDQMLNRMCILTGGRDTILYAHNLAFDGDFAIKNISNPSKVVATAPHRPISMILNKHPHINFRCSYQLIDKSLKAIGEEIGLPKLDNDYKKLERGELPTEEDWIYCERDCDIVASKILQYIKEYGNIWKIPLTKTGIVREMLREYCERLDSHREWDLLPDHDAYRIMRNAFYGGISMGNPAYIGYHVKGVASFDMSSAYPFSALTGKFPRTITRSNSTEIPASGAWIARIRFTGITSKFDWGWLPSSRIKYRWDSIIFNGKLIESEEIEMTLCNIDFASIEMTYTWSDLTVIELWEGDTPQPLPSPIYNLFTDLAERKQTAKIVYKQALKDGLDSDTIEKLAIDYAKAKERFNSLYGMMVQEFEQEDFEVDATGHWKTLPPKYGGRKKHMNRNYLFGVFITAYTRNNLLRFAVTNGGNELIYVDTDSVKIPDDGREIIDTNRELYEALDHSKIGNLGEWEREEYGKAEKKSNHIDTFKCFGAKKYLIEAGGEIKLTVAGLPHKDPHGNPITSTIDGFTLGTTWERCKLARAFIYASGEMETPDDITTRRYIDGKVDSGGCALYETGYTLGMTLSDITYIKQKYGRTIR